MSLYGALFSGVSGLSSESSAMGAIADNISNVNTIGYKGTDVNFNTLVTTQVSLTQYSPGGVQSAPRAAIDVQGLLQATSSSTDMAISGQGFFIVNSTSNPATQGGEFAYTRAGSFIPNQTGYLQNAAGFYLQGWPLTPTDNSVAAKPSEVNINGTTYMTAYKNPDGTFHYINQNIVSPTELQPLNLNTIGGTAQATSNVSIGANLPSGDDDGAVHESNVLLYDSLGNSTNAQFTFTKAAANSWSLQVTPPSGAAVATLYNTTTNTSPPPVYASTGQLEFNSLPPDDSYFTISGPGANSQTNPTVQVQFYNSATEGAKTDIDQPVQESISGGAGTPWVSTVYVDLNGVNGTAQLTGAIATALQNAATGNSSAGPTPIIGSVLSGGMSNGVSRFVSNNSSVLSIVQAPGASSLTINCVANSSTLLGSSIVESGTNSGSGLAGGPLGQFTVPAIWAGGTTSEPQSYSQPTGSTNSFIIGNTISGATPPTGNLVIGNVSVPWSEIASGTITQYDDLTLPAGAQTVVLNNPITLNSGNPINTPADFAQAAADTINGLDNPVPPDTTVFSGYTATASDDTVQLTMSSTSTALAIIPDQGGGSSEITWGDNTAGNQGELTGPQAAYASVAEGFNFNGDGTPSAGQFPGLSTAIPGIVPTSMTLDWADGAENQVQAPGANQPLQPPISLNFGSANESNGVTQLGGQYNINFIQQNGAKFGNFSGVSIGTNGIVTALFDNGVRTPVFQIPVATFPNPDGLQSETGNVYIDTTTSGNYTVRQAGTGGSGTVAQASLEASTVDLGTQFTTMITVQRAYSAAAKVITTTDGMLSDLIQIIR